MIQVAFVDSVATNIPRTLVDLKTGLAASLETMRREFSGLFVNCLIPGFIVKGVAKVLPKAPELAGTDVVNSWANGNVIGKLSTVYNEAQASGATDKTRAYVEKALTSLEGLDFSHNHALKSLNLSKSKALKSLICFGTKITSMIPDWFSQINFEYDPRYEYQTIINQWGHEEKIYKDKGVGWWYPGEPERGYH